jgi:formylglycine-generating enzyme required for sulfatase activity
VGTGCDKDDKWADEGCWDEKKVFHCKGEIHKFKDWYACPGYRLPSSAEWEYAARAGTTTHTYNGDILPQGVSDCVQQPALDSIAWYCRNAGGQYHAVAQKQPNPWGLFDMLGNVYEWTDYFSDGQPLDWDREGQALSDPLGPTSGNLKERRGGVFAKSGCDVNASWQSSDLPVTRSFWTSFRPVRTIFE